MTTPFGMYQHYKGGLYTVLFVALESTNGRERRPVVVYISHATGAINVRDEAEFNGSVMVYGRVTPRFQLHKPAPVKP